METTTTFVADATLQQVIDFSVEVSCLCSKDKQVKRIGERLRKRQLVCLGGENLLFSSLTWVCDKEGRRLWNTPHNPKPVYNISTERLTVEAYTPKPELGFAWDDIEDGWQGFSMHMERRFGSILLALPKQDWLYRLICQPWSFDHGPKRKCRWLKIFTRLGVTWQRLPEGTPQPASETAEWLFVKMVKPPGR